jgi:c-di-GMP-binding flagellar brake protein YcgR
MKTLHCPSCGTPYVRLSPEQSKIGRILNQIKVFPFRCQLCTNRFRAFWSNAPDNILSTDRRQYKRLPTTFHADFVMDKTLQANKRVTDISMGGCTVETAETLPQGTYLELTIRPVSNQSEITVGTARVSSVRPEGMGIQFLEFQPEEKRRLSRVVLSLLVGQGVQPVPYS